MITRHEPDPLRPLAWAGMWIAGVGVMAACVAILAGFRACCYAVVECAPQTAIAANPANPEEIP